MAERSTGIPKLTGTPGELRTSTKPLPTLTPGEASAPAQGPGGFKAPGKGGLPGGSGPGAGDVKASPKATVDLEAGHIVRNNIEKAVFGTPAIPGAYWDNLAAEYEQRVAELKQEQLQSESFAYELDKLLIPYQDAVAFKAAKAFEKIRSYDNALLTWKEQSNDALASAEYRESFRNPHAVVDAKRNLVRYYLDCPAFVKLWSTAGAGSFPSSNEAVQTAYPTGKDGFTFQDFPLLLDNKDQVVDGKVVPSVLRAMHEQDNYFLEWVHECLVRLVQFADYPTGNPQGYWGKDKFVDGKPVAKLNNGALKWAKVPSSYTGGYPAGFGGQMWFLAGPTAKHAGPSWLSSGQKAFSYNGWWLDNEIADYVAVLVAFKIAIQNRAATKANDFGSIANEIKEREQKIQVYKKKAQEERDNVPKDLGAFLKKKLEIDAYGDPAKPGAQKYGDPALTEAAKKYVDICIDLRSLYDTVDPTKAPAFAKNMAQLTTINYEAIEEALGKAQWIADNKLAKATNEAEKKKAFEELWTFLTVAKDSGVESCVDQAKKEYKAYSDFVASYQPDPQIAKYASFVFPEDLVAVGIDGWGPEALKTPIAVVKEAMKPISAAQDFSSAISRAIKDLDQYNKLVKMLPAGYVPPWQGDKPIPATEVTVTQTYTPGISLSMTAVQATPGESTQLAVSQIDSTGKVSTPTKVSWASSDPTVASVSDSGIVTANAIGNTTVTAKVDAFEATVTVKVAAPAETTKGPNWLLIGGAAAAAFLLVSMLGGKSKE